MMKACNWRICSVSGCFIFIRCYDRLGSSLAKVRWWSLSFAKLKNAKRRMMLQETARQNVESRQSAAFNLEALT